MKIVLFGTSNVALPVLELLREHHDVVTVVTSPDSSTGRKRVLTPSPVALLAEELRIPLLKPERVKNNLELVGQLQKLDADIFIVVSYGKILPQEIIDMPQLKTLNIHFSRLPEYRGAAPIQFALLNGDRQTATTIFVLDEQLDHGPIITQATAVIEPDDNFLTLSQRLARQSAELLIDALPDYENGRITPREQDHDQATHTKIITKQDGRIDWNCPAQAIYNQFRAFYPWPGIWTMWEGKIIKVLDCLPAENVLVNAPGTVHPDGIVACGNGTALQIKTLQIEGKQPASIYDFINGYNNFSGSFLQK